MAVAEADIKYYLTGGAGNTDPNASLGGTTSSTQVSASIHGIFDHVAGEEAVAGDTEYRAITVKNTHASDTLYSAVLWIYSETSSADDTVALAYDEIGIQSVANESTAPSDPVLTFSTPTSKATGISLGDMAFGESRRIWLRRTVGASASRVTSSGSLRVEGDS